jgi:proline iminopeptidase
LNYFVRELLNYLDSPLRGGLKVKEIKQEVIYMRIIIPLFLLTVLLSCTGGAYIPGNVKNSMNLVPPEQTDSSGEYWQMDGETKLFHFTQGEPGAKQVLLVHGGPGVPFQEDWPGLAGIDGFQFFYYHQRGCGKSTIPFNSFESKNYSTNMKALESRLGLARHLEDIEKIRRIMGHDKITLIGHSFGGFLAALYAVEFPDNVEKLILVEPADMLSFPPTHGGMNQIQTWLNEDQNSGYEKFLDEYFNYGSLFKKTENNLAQLNQQYGTFYLQAMRNRFPERETKLTDTGKTEGIGGFSIHAVYFSLGRKYNYHRNMRELSVPTLVIHGAMDLYGPEASLDWAASIPGAVYNEFEDSGHFPFIEEPEEFRMIVGSFLNDQ